MPESLEVSPPNVDGAPRHSLGAKIRFNRAVSQSVKVAAPPLSRPKKSRQPEPSSPTDSLPSCLADLTAARP